MSCVFDFVVWRDILLVRYLHLLKEMKSKFKKK